MSDEASLKALTAALRSFDPASFPTQIVSVPSILIISLDLLIWKDSKYAQVNPTAPSLRKADRPDRRMA